MSSFIRFTPLAGSRCPHSAALAHVLQVDDCRLLLDCGWREEEEEEEGKGEALTEAEGGAEEDKEENQLVASLREVAPSIDAVLLSHALSTTAGLLPLAFAKLGLDCPVYAATPVADLGLLALTDALVAQASRGGGVSLFSRPDIIAAFERVIPVRYSQPISLDGRAKGITCTAYAAGHSLGGSVWRIAKDTDVVVYAVQWNHKREKHLPPSALLTSPNLLKPSILITSSITAQAPAIPRKTRDTQLLQTLLTTLRTDGSVLLPIDPVRVLEIAYLLDTYWSQHRLPYPIYFLSPVSARIFADARGMLEWCGTDVEKEFAEKRENPFDFKNVKPVTSVPALNTPAVIITTSDTFDHGLARALIPSFASDPNNTIILTSPSTPTSLTRTLWTMYYESLEAQKSNTERDSANATLADKDTATATAMASAPEKEKEKAKRDKDPDRMSLSTKMPLVLHRREALSGPDLEAFKAKQEHAEEEQKLLTPVVTKMAYEIEEESEEEEEQVTATTTTTRGYDTFMKGREANMATFFKGGQAYKMYPVFDVRRRWDDYGEAVTFRFDDAENKENKRGGAGDDPDPNNPIKSEPNLTLLNEPLPKLLPDDTDEILVPSRYFVDPVIVSLVCGVRVIRFDGLADGRGLMNTIARLDARKIILVDGDDESTDFLKRYLVEDLNSEVFDPRVGESVNVSAAGSIVQVKLTDRVTSGLKSVRVGKYEVSYISGVVHAPEESGLNPSLDVVPFAASALHKPVRVGTVKLMELRRVLEHEGFEVDVMAGCLRVGKSVLLKRVESGWVVHGRVGRVWRRVRDVLGAYVGVL